MKREQVMMLLTMLLCFAVLAPMLTGCLHDIPSSPADYRLSQPILSQETETTLREAVRAAVVLEHPELKPDQIDARVMEVFREYSPEILAAQREAALMQTRIEALQSLTMIVSELIRGGPSESEGD